MTDCRACGRPTDLYLCADCEQQLADMLDQIPWLLTELDARIQRLDRISSGTIGRNRGPDQLNIVDFDALEMARNIRKLLLQWVQTVAGHTAGRGLHTTATPDLARWLRANTSRIARQPFAGKLYNDIRALVGADQRGGQLIAAINPTEHHLVGPCPTITGRQPDGHPRQCGHILFADTYDRTVDCPTCGQTIDVEHTRRAAAAARDLHTRNDLLEVLANIDEPITTSALDDWIRARRLRPGGYQHNTTIIEFRIHPTDEPVYSVDRARKLRRRDNHLTQRKTTA